MPALDVLNVGELDASLIQSLLMCFYSDKVAVCDNPND
jgi:hypothetical protein